MNRRMVTTLVWGAVVLAWAVSLIFNLVDVGLETGLFFTAALVVVGVGISLKGAFRSQLLLAVLVATSFLTGCGTVVIDGPINQNPIHSAPISMGGTDVTILNGVRGDDVIKMSCQIQGLRFSGDSSLKTEAVTSDTARFFFKNQGLRDRHEATILCRFYALVEEPVEEGKEPVQTERFLGTRSERISLSNRGGQFESKFIEIRRIDQPERIRLRD